jgi:hypothetical protein
MNKPARRRVLAVCLSALLAVLCLVAPARARAESWKKRLLTPEEALFEEGYWLRRTGKIVTITGGAIMAVGGVLIGLGLGLPHLNCNSFECHPAGVPTALLGAGIITSVVGLIVTIPGVIMWPLGDAKMHEAAQQQAAQGHASRPRLQLTGAPAGSLGLGLAWSH